MSFKEHKKRQSFINNIEDKNIKLRLFNSLNDNHFWKLAKFLGLTIPKPDLEIKLV